jgi:hypothetical protein
VEGCLGGRRGCLVEEGGLEDMVLEREVVMALEVGEDGSGNCVSICVS